MPFQVSPGIVVTERDLTTVVPNVATSIGAIAGGFQWGPVLERTSITNENDLVRYFGKPDDTTAEWFLTAANFLGYSNNLLVVRNVLTSARNSVVGDGGTAGTALQVHNGLDYDSKVSAMSDQMFVAKYPGALGNSLKVHAIDGHGWAATMTVGSDAEKLQKIFKSSFDRAPGTSTDVATAGGSDDEMHVIVIDEFGLWTGMPGEVIETHGFISKALDGRRIDGSSSYIGSVLRNESDYIWLGAASELADSSVIVDDSGVLPGTTKFGATFRSFDSANELHKMPGGSMTGGVDGNALTDSELQAAYVLYQNPDVVDVSLVMAGPASTVTGRYIIDNITSTRKDCIALVSPNKASVVHAGNGQLAALETDNTALGSSSYAVMDGAWKYQYDRYNDVFRYAPMNGDIAGLCARTDYTNDAWWSPAGFNRGTIKNIVRTSWEPTTADRDVMYQLGINPLATPRGSGVILYGDKTMLSVPSAFDRINVRRLFIVLEKAIAIAAKSMLFEFNDEFTRSQFVNIVTPFLRNVQGRRGITDFKVICDSTNNTGQVIDTNNFVGDIFIKPTRSINFIQLNFIAARTDVSFSEIGG
jgi:phage tail sheath protein FI